MARRYDTISFLSDFGHADEFVGVVHSVIRSIAPQVQVIDITHGIARHNTRAGGLALARAADYLNAGVVVAVVDPGVGSGRRAVAIEVGDGESVLVGPDNGLLAPIVGLVGGATRAVELTGTKYRLPPSCGVTFDGRDVFAPAAAHLCNGVAFADIGVEIDPAVLMPAVLPISQFDEGRLRCEVLWIDHFGNCQLNVDPTEIETLGREVVVEIDSEQLVGMVVGSYDEISAGRVGLLVDSGGLLSLAVNRASAAEELSLGEGRELTIRALDSSDRGAAGVTVQLGRRNGQP